MYRLQDWTQDSKDLILHAYVHLKEKGREIILFFFYVCYMLWKPLYSGSTRTDPVLVPFLVSPGAWTEEKDDEPKLISPGQKKKKKKVSMNQVKGGS